MADESLQKINITQNVWVFILSNLPSLIFILRYRFRLIFSFSNIFVWEKWNNEVGPNDIRDLLIQHFYMYFFPCGKAYITQKCHWYCFQMYSSSVLNIFVSLCKYNHMRLQNFLSSQIETPYLLNNNPYSSLLLAPGTHHSISMNLTTLCTSDKWNPTGFILL